jgi:hypothetical protein
MRPLSILIAIGGMLIVSGCADPLEQRSGNEVQSQLQRGLTGQGEIVPEQRDPRDPAGEHSVPTTHP